MTRAKRSRTCKVTRIHRFFNDNIRITVAHTLTVRGKVTSCRRLRCINRSNSAVAPHISTRRIHHVRSVFHPCCTTRYTVRANRCTNVDPLLHRLQTTNVRATIISGGPSPTIRGLATSCFRNLFSLTLNRRPRVQQGPTPSVILGTLGSSKLAPRRTICVNSSRVSVRATRGTKLSYLDIA